jgi:hypothetical protein
MLLVPVTAAPVASTAASSTTLRLRSVLSAVPAAVSEEHAAQLVF